MSIKGSLEVVCSKIMFCIKENAEERAVLILRGLPGSGKSSFAKGFSGATVCSADDFFIVNGQYKYDPSLFEEAHSRCLVDFIQAVVVNRAEPWVVVDNTNTSAMEIVPYLRIARAFGYSVYILEFESTILESLRWNIHGVPEGVICKMAMKMSQGLPEYFECISKHWFLRINSDG
jgi:predicted kinase